jgi:hypothetical protein
MEETMLMRTFSVASVLGLTVAFCASANPIILPSGAYIDEDLHIQITSNGAGLQATVTSEFALVPQNDIVTSILFPIPRDSRNVAVFLVTGTTETPITWQWNTDPWNNYTTIVPEEPNLPIIEWFGPWTSYATVRFKVTYQHDLIERPDEKVFFYASGVSKLSGTTQFLNVDFNITLPPGYSAVPHLDTDTVIFDLFRYQMTFSITPPAPSLRIYKDIVMSLKPDASMGDCNHDGIPNYEDLSYSLTFAGTVYLLSRPTISPTDYQADFNGDGFIDKVQLASGWPHDTATVMFSDSNGVFTPGQTFAADDPYHVKTFDIDGDGDMDFAVAGVQSVSPWFPFVTIYLNDGTGHFRRLTTVSATTAGYNPQVWFRPVQPPQLVLFYTNYSDSETRKAWKITSTPPTATDLNANNVPDSCEGLIPGDLDFNGVRDANDACAFSRQWLRSNCKLPVWCLGADFNRNGTVDFLDYALFANAWMHEE